MDKKEVTKVQALIWGGLQEKFSRHKQDTQMTAGALLKLILSEYYGKLNKDYNDIKK